MIRPPLALYLFMLIALVVGGWLAYDGVRAQLTGEYAIVGGEPGAWAVLPRAAGVEPSRLGFFLVVVGCEWGAVAGGVWLRHRWAYNLALGLCAITLLVVPVGKALAVIAAALLAGRGVRGWMAQKSPQAG